MFDIVWHSCSYDGHQHLVGPWCADTRGAAAELEPLVTLVTPPAGQVTQVSAASSTRPLTYAYEGETQQDGGAPVVVDTQAQAVAMLDRHAHKIAYALRRNDVAAALMLTRADIWVRGIAYQR